MVDARRPVSEKVNHWNGNRYANKPVTFWLIRSFSESDREFFEQFVSCRCTSTWVGWSICNKRNFNEKFNGDTSMEDFYHDLPANSSCIQDTDLQLMTPFHGSACVCVPKMANFLWWDETILFVSLNWTLSIAFCFSVLQCFSTIKYRKIGLKIFTSKLQKMNVDLVYECLGTADL